MSRISQKHIPIYIPLPLPLSPSHFFLGGYIYINFITFRYIYRKRAGISRFFCHKGCDIFGDFQKKPLQPMQISHSTCNGLVFGLEIDRLEGKRGDDIMTNDNDAKPSPERVRQMFRFRDGRFYWLSRPLSDFKSERAFDIWQRCHALSDVMQLHGRAWNTNKRRQSVKIDGKSYPIINVLWCWHHGRWPMGKVERIDGNPDNNSAENLRMA